MRSLLLVPVFILSLACGRSHLSRSEAEHDLRKDYPVVVTIAVPESAKAIKGSPEHAKLLASTGWFVLARSPDGDREQFSFKLSASAPKSVRATAKGFQLPAAEAEFVKASRLETLRDGARVTYQVRMVRPTATFALFQTLHPGIKPGDTRDRHATYRKDGRAWILQETDETFKKAE